MLFKACFWTTNSSKTEDINFTNIYDKEKQQVITSEKLEQANV